MKKVKKEVENCGNCRIWGACNKPESVKNNCDNWEPVKKANKCIHVIGYNSINGFVRDVRFGIPQKYVRFCSECGKKINHGVKK